VLEDSGHEHARVAGKNLFGAVAVMHVEIDDRHAFQAPGIEGMARRDGDIVEETETHRLRPLGVVSRRAHGAKCILHFAAHHQVGRVAACAGRTQRRLQGTRRHRRVGIEMHDAVRRTAVMHVIDVVARMNAQQLLHLDQRRVMELQVHVEAGGNQAIADRAEPIGTFRMVGAHVVLQAVAMGDEGGGCHDGSLA
jgi:hypothetical protein